jgi:hypothetical protein
MTKSVATNGKTDPVFPVRNLPPAMPVELHPKAQQAAAAWSDMCGAIERQEAEIGQLRADLAVERRHVSDLQRMLDAKIVDSGRYQRYAIEIRTRLARLVKDAESLKATTLEADSCALEFSLEEPPTEARPDAVAAVEKAIAGVAHGRE